MHWGMGTFHLSERNAFFYNTETGVIIVGWILAFLDDEETYGLAKRARVFFRDAQVLRFVVAMGDKLNGHVGVESTYEMYSPRREILEGTW